MPKRSPPDSLDANVVLRVPAASLHSQVSHAVAELTSATEMLRGLAAALDQYGGTNARADAGELREAAIGIRASAVQTLLTACTVVGLSERLVTLGRLQELAESTPLEP
jgi:hypothetical protein